MVDILATISNFIDGKYKFQHTGLIINKKNKQIINQSLKFLLKNVTNLLDKHDIEYVISDGTLLGAYRNNKFIPWDDDIDIRVNPKHWNKLKRIIKEKNNITHNKLNWIGPGNCPGDNCYQVEIKDLDLGKTTDSLHVDVVNAEYTSNVWSKAAYLFSEKLDKILLEGDYYSCPNKKSIEKNLELLYGKTWKIPQGPYKKYIKIVNAILIPILILLLYFSIKKQNPIFIILFLFLLVIVYKYNRNNRDKIIQ
jgi:hypothetical protein